jgi:hypothetical protein
MSELDAFDALTKGLANFTAKSLANYDLATGFGKEPGHRSRAIIPGDDPGDQQPPTRSTAAPARPAAPAASADTAAGQSERLKIVRQADEMVRAVLRLQI